MTLFSSSVCSSNPSTMTRTLFFPQTKAAKAVQMVRFPKFDHFDPRIPRPPHPKGLGRLDRFDPAREVKVEGPAMDGPAKATSAASAICINLPSDITMG